MAATAIMAALLNALPEASSLIVLIGHIMLGASVYVTAIGVFYAPSLLKMFRLRQRESES
jgi:hypothetical protein